MFSKPHEEEGKKSQYSLFFRRIFPSHTTILLTNLATWLQRMLGNVVFNSSILAQYGCDLKEIENSSSALGASSYTLSAVRGYRGDIIKMSNLCWVPKER